MDNPIILCGLGRTGWRVLDYLRAAGLPVVVVDTVCQPDDARLQGTPLIRGDFRQREVLIQAGVESARGVLVLTSDDLINIATALTVRALNRSVRIVVRLFNQNLLGRLGKAVENIFALSTSLLTAPMLALTAITGQGLGSFRIEGVEEGRRQVVELVVEEGSEYIGRRIGDLPAGRDLHVLAHRRPGEYLRLLSEVQGDTPIQAGDQVVLCGPPKELTPLLTGLRPGEGTRLSWVRWMRKQLPAFFRTLPDLDLALRWVLFTLVLVVVVGVLTLTFIAGNSLVDALVRTVTVLTTSHSSGDEKGADSVGIKLFLTVLRVTGTALVALITALLTNYLLRARLGQALEVRRVPEGGHIVVCGLSPVGYRVIEELIHAGERPVVVERDETNRFVVTVRRQGVPVIVGDATVSEVLRQANAGMARAVVVATNHDLVNLEVALLVRELNEEQRVVVLQSDPTLAQMLREAANIHLAVNIHALAAPAFLAGLFGDRVLNVILVRDRILAVVDLIALGAEDVLLEQSLRTIAVDFHLMPIALIPASGIAPASPMMHRFGPGDRVIGIIALSDLERLLKREAPAHEYGVEIASVPLPARPWLVGLVRTLRNWSQQEAERSLETLPLRVAEGQTRGQAEDLLARLQREKVSARLLAPPPAVPVPEGDDGE
jgi:Trk K+ transport system NAD-binding subunit